MSAPKVKLKVNLKDLFGVSGTLSQATKERVGQAIIDRIAERTGNDRKDRFDKTMAGYSKGYAKSLFGQIYGKRAGQSANLLATGDMLSSMNILEQSRDTITIGFDDQTQNDKAYGHISGMRGHPTLSGKVPVRDFMGISPSDARNLKAELSDEIETLSRIDSARTEEEFESAVLDAIAEIEGGLG